MRTVVGMERVVFAILVTRETHSSVRRRPARCAASCVPLLMYLYGERRRAGEGVYSSFCYLFIKWNRKSNGRFGKGIYTSSTSSKSVVFQLLPFQFFSQTLLTRSNDYSHNDCKSSLKAILLNKVIVGKGCKLLQDNTALTAPPAGYDSVSVYLS